MDKTQRAAGSPSGEPVRVCTKCGASPAPSNSSWCRQCRNEYAAGYRARMRPKPRTEERVCALEGCGQVFIWRSTHPKQTCCSKEHYGKWRWRRDHPDPAAAGEIYCTRCQRPYPDTAFSPSRRHLKRSQCRECMAEYRRSWEDRNGARRSATTRRSRSARLLRKHGAPYAALDEAVNAQGGGCAICRGPKGQREYHVDHDHTKPEGESYRGILCHGCNVGLGGFRDDPKLLLAAVRYLDRGVMAGVLLPSEVCLVNT
jgi:hypothetical protein